ncbi:MAG: CopG family antitoxin [Candidatus Dormibacteria bacterium]
MRKARARLEEVHGWSDVPKFRSEAEEAEWWSSHSLSEEMLADFKPVPEEGDDWLPPARSRTRPIAVRFDDATLDRIKELAGRRHTGYQTLLKQFVIERVYEEEKREGIIGERVIATAESRSQLTSVLTSTTPDDPGRRKTKTAAGSTKSIRQRSRRTHLDKRQDPS